MTVLSKDSRHNQLKDMLIQKIKNCSAGTKLPAERSLAEEFSVSRPTINKVMVALEQEGYVTRRVGQGTFVSPRDKTVLQGIMKHGAKEAVIIAYPDFFSYDIWQEIHYAELMALKENFNLINLKFQPQTDFNILLDLIDKTDNLRGVIIHTSLAGITKHFFNNIDSFGIPIVMLCTMNNVTIFRNIYEVRFDHFKSGYLRAECLLKNGHRQIGFVPNEPGLTINSLPIKGMRQAFREYGLCWKDIAQPKTKVKDWQDPMKVAYNQTLELLKNNELTALLFETIRGALGGMRAIFEMGLKCPDDISIVTSMGHMGLEKMSCPSLTTIPSKNQEIINKAFEIILSPEDMVSKSILVDVELKQRESVKKISKEVSLLKINSKQTQIKQTQIKQTAQILN